MVSRRNFLTITLIMMVLLFMFQAPVVIRDQLNHYENNAYAQTQETKLNRDSTAGVQQYRAKGKRQIVYIGDTDDDGAGAAVKLWTMYAKRSLDVYPKLTKYRPDFKQMPEAVVIDASRLNKKKDLQRLEELTQKGVHLIFCGLPDIELLNSNKRWKRLLGIRKVLPEQAKMKGIHLFDGLLLGGEKIYKLDASMSPLVQDLDLYLPWCQLASGTKTYMAGMMDDTVKNEEVPAIIWRNSVGQARVFVVNGDYINGNAGIGLLEGMMYEACAYAIYPVINAQNLVVLNFPSFSDENKEEMMRLYSRSLEAVYRDLIWPGLSVTAEKSGKKLTCMLAAKQDGQAAQSEEKQLRSHMKLIQEQFGEAGISGAVPIADDDSLFFARVIPEYAFLSFYEGQLTERETERAVQSDLLGNVRTIFADYERKEPLVSYQNTNMTRQCATDDAWDEQTFSENLRLHSIETALGYSSIAIDMNRIACPRTQEDRWEKRYDTFSGNVNTYWKAYEAFDATTLAESDVRIRRFLALDYMQHRSGDAITLHMESFEKEAYFILRLHQEIIKKARGADYVKIQKGAYLIKAKQEEIEITLGKETSMWSTIYE